MIDHLMIDVVSMRREMAEAIEDHEQGVTYFRELPATEEEIHMLKVMLLHLDRLIALHREQFDLLPDQYRERDRQEFEETFADLNKPYDDDEVEIEETVPPLQEQARAAGAWQPKIAVSLTPKPAAVATLPRRDKKSTDRKRKS
jgi:hypothetical protein